MDCRLKIELELSLPLGLGLNFDINGEKYSIPMAIEEPSVIATASSGANFIFDNGSRFKMYRVFHKKLILEQIYTHSHKKLH